MRSRFIFLGSAAALFSAAAAGAQGLEQEARIVAAFTAVCLQHMGDPAAQTAAATAAPWGFVPDGLPADDGVTRYRSGPHRIGISEPLGACTSTGEAGPGVTLATMQSAMTAALGTDDGQPLLQADSRAWIVADADDEQHVLALKVSGETGRNLVTLWVQRRAALANPN